MANLSLFEQAICFAVDAHHGQVRKGESVPYIIHPLEVASICASMTADQEVLAAAVLHDTVEDTETTPEEIELLFGKRVALLVASETEDKRRNLPPNETWHIRKEESLAALRKASDPGVRILWLADKLANMRSFYRAWKSRGCKFWTIFNQNDPKEQAWYYRSVAGILTDLKDSDAWQEFNYYIEQVFHEV